MTSLPSEVLRALRGRTLATAESITGGGIGAALTGVPGSSAVYKGGIISYCDQVKASALGVDPALLREKGAVSAEVAREMARGVRMELEADIAVSVTGLAGPDGDAYGNRAGTVFIGFAGEDREFSREYHFTGDREAVRSHTIRAALELILEENEK